jgi:glycosyltransferase involved in cell wall biosynthesis
LTASIRIAYYTDSETIGGAEVLLGNLLAELDPAIDAVIAGVKQPVIDFLAGRRPGSQVQLIRRVRRKTDLDRIAETVRRVRSLRAQIFHANLSVPSACQYALTAATIVPGLRTIAVEQLPYPLDGALQLRLKRFTSHRLAAHVAVGDRSAREVEALVGLDDGSVRTIHNAVADVELVPVERRFAGPVIGAIGRLDRQKGFDVLLRALTELPGTGLVLVGDGPERDPLQRLAAELGLAGRVEFQGWHENARRQLGGFDVFVLPSRFEGFPLAIVEAMLARVPVVATTVGSVPESVLDGVTGRLVAPEDPHALSFALRQLLADAGLRARMGAAGREHALNFGLGPMARAYEALYEEVLA